MFIEYFLNRNKYDVIKDYEEEKKKHQLYLYKKQVLEMNGFKKLAFNLQNPSIKFHKINVDGEGLEEAVDVSDIYSADNEVDEIKKTVNNIQFLRQTLNTYDYCRTRCKISDQTLRNLVSFPRESQMCFTDCLNVRGELFGDNKRQEKTFVWLA
jgi:hypothetical protein